MSVHAKTSMRLIPLLIATISSGVFAATKSLGEQDTLVVDREMRFQELSLAKGTKVLAPEGYDLTMTVEGVNVDVLSGKYIGDVVLTPTKHFLVKYPGYKPYHFRSALLINNGEIKTDQSVLAALNTDSIDHRTLNDAKITSKQALFNGIVVDGKSRYTINNLTMSLEGNGGNDFAGWGAGVASLGESHVTINGANIKTHGAIRPALFIGGKSTMVVNDAMVETFSGQLPDGYTFSIAPGAMMEVPYGLGLEGNVRSTNLIDEATVYYNNSHFIAHGWGALSSDGNGPTRMFVKDSIIETVGSGYGAYANGDSHDYFSHTTFNVADYGVIVGGPGWVTLTDGTTLNSDKIGVMMHQGAGGSMLRVEKGSQINSKNSAVQIKGRGSDVVFDNAVINAGNGILVQAMPNDDPIMRDMAKMGPPPPPPGMDMSELPPPMMPGAEAMNFSPDVNVNIRNSELKGDIAHGMINSANMSVYLQNATLEGAISTSETHPSSGNEPTRETFATVGEVDNTYQAIQSEKALFVSVDGNSTWLVDKTSYLDQLILAEGAVLKSATNKPLMLLVNGKSHKIEAGVFTGDITIEVSP